MDDHRFIPEFDSPSRRTADARPVRAAAHVVPSASLASQARRTIPRRFRKGDAVAEIRERNGRDVIEWSLVLNGHVVTTRQFSEVERAAYDHELYGVTTDLKGSGWLEELTSVA